MAHSAIQENGQSSTYKPVHFMIRARLYKGLNDGSMTVRSLFDDEKEKMKGETCCCFCYRVLKRKKLSQRLKGKKDGRKRYREDY